MTNYAATEVIAQELIKEGSEFEVIGDGECAVQS